MINAVTYEEQAAQMTAKARDALLKAVSRDCDKALESVELARTHQLKALNFFRTAGVKLQEAAGREQVTFEFFRKIESQLPKQMTFEGAKFCVHLANRFPDEIKSLNEVRMQQLTMHETFGDMVSPKRIGQQESHEHNPVSEFISWASSFEKLFSGFDDKPLGEWGREKLSKFVSTTAPIVEKHAEAKRLLGQ